MPDIGVSFLTNLKILVTYLLYMYLSLSEKLSLNPSSFLSLFKGGCTQIKSAIFAFYYSIIFYVYCDVHIYLLYDL